MANTVIDEKFAAIIDAVSYWLGYQLKIGRHQLIHEASLRYPIADTLTSKRTSIDKIVLEKLHPLFKSKRIDLVTYDENVINPEVEKSDDKLKEVFEFKIAKRDTSKDKSIEHQRGFDDIIRLAYYHQWRKKDCYFLMCGKYEDFKTYFIGQKSDILIQNNKNIVVQKRFQTKRKSAQIDFKKWKPDGLYKNWFGFKIGEEKEKEFKIENPNDKGEWGLQSFKSNYHIRKDINKFFSNFIKIRTKCLAITPAGLEKTRTHAVGIWKIE